MGKWAIYHSPEVTEPFFTKKEERKKEKEKVEKLEKTPRWVIKSIKTAVIY